MTHTYSAYKRPTSGQNTYINWKWRVGKNVPSKRTGEKSWGGNIHIKQNWLQIKAIKRNRKGHFIMIKWRTYQEHINIVNIYALNTGVPKYIRKILDDFKKDIESIIPAVELLGQRTVPFLVSWGNSILFSTVAAPVCIPTNSALGFPFLHILSNICLLICLCWDYTLRTLKHPSKRTCAPQCS